MNVDKNARMTVHDRSSMPHRSPRRPAPELMCEIARLRRMRRTGPRIAGAFELPISTFGLTLRRLSLGRRGVLDPPVPVIRYQRARPGKLIHIDAKKRGRIDGIGHRIIGRRRGRKRGGGREFPHLAVDDAPRLACTEILPDERGPTCADLLNRTVQWLAELGVPIERVMTDNAFAYANSRDFRHALATVGARHLTAKPYRSHTDGKAACFIQSALQEWLYAKPTPAPANAQTT